MDAINRTQSFQLFVVVLDTSLVWEMLVLPSDVNAVPSLPSVRMPDGDTTDHSRDYERIFPKNESTFHARIHGSQVKFQASKNVLSRFPFPTSHITFHVNFSTEEQ